MTTVSVLEIASEALREGKGEPVEIDERALPAIERALTALADKIELVDAVEELALFAVWLGKDKGSPKARDQLFAIAHKSIPALEKLGADAKATLDAVRAASSAKDYSRFTGRDEPRVKKAGPTSPDAVSGGPLARHTLLAKDPKKPKK